jgi:excinuclease ABC subunit C
MDRTAELREKVRAGAENRPGVYRMHGPSGELLYVGKSIRVRGRLLSYFRADRGDKAAEIIGHAHDVDWSYEPDEFAAVLTEFRLIREHRPLYNVEHKRKRAVCFVKVPRETAARLLVTSEVADDGASYHGPLLGIQRVRLAIRDLASVLELRDCPAKTPLRLGDQPDLFGVEYTPRCPRAELRRCLGPCAARCTEREYDDRLELALRFLAGATDLPLKMLEQRLTRAVERWQYEYAAELQERITRLAGVRQELGRVRGMLERLSCVYAPEAPGADGRWYVLHGGRLKARLDAPKTPAERRLATRTARRILAAPATPPARLGADGIAETLLVMRWFRRRPEEWNRRVTLGDGAVRERLRIA